MLIEFAPFSSQGHVAKVEKRKANKSSTYAQKCRTSFFATTTTQLDSQQDGKSSFSLVMLMIWEIEKEHFHFFGEKTKRFTFNRSLE